MRLPNSAKYNVYIIIITHGYTTDDKSAQRQRREQVFQLSTLPKPLVEGRLSTHSLVQPARVSVRYTLGHNDSGQRT